MRRKWGSGGRSTGLGMLRKRRNETVSRAAKRTSTFPLDVARVLVGTIFSVEVGTEVRWPGLEDSVGMRKQAEHVSHLS